MEDLSFLDQYPIIKIITYIIIFVFGQVVYKYYNLYVTKEESKSVRNANSNQKLIENLQDRINKMTDDLGKLEKDRNEVHKRELERVRELAEAKSEVKLLNLKLEHLEEAVKTLTKVVGEYEDRYGKLNNKS